MQRRIALAAGLTAATAILTATTAAGAPPTPSGRDLAAMRAATAKYHDVNVAIADGYGPVSGCEASPDGVMGFHYLHPGRAGDAVLTATEPELLLYVPGEDGLELAAVEYFVAAAAVPEGEHPSILGVEFDGPMPGHNPQMPVHYDLHVWTWKHNPAGMTAQWNPALKCPAE